MAKKQQDEIIEKLSALKPNVPTSSRSAVAISNKKTTVEVSKEKDELSISSLMRNNVSEVLQWGGIMVKESEQVFLTVLDGWQQSFTLYTTLMLKNLNYIINFLSKKK